jgi:hypothetical protein
LLPDRRAVTMHSAQNLQRHKGLFTKNTHLFTICLQFLQFFTICSQFIYNLFTIYLQFIYNLFTIYLQFIYNFLQFVYIMFTKNTNLVSQCAAPTCRVVRQKIGLILFFVVRPNILSEFVPQGIWRHVVSDPKKFGLCKFPLSKCLVFLFQVLGNRLTYGNLDSSMKRS